VYCFGEEQALNGPPSSEQAKVAFWSSAVKVKVAFLSVVVPGGAPPGGEPSVVWGATVSAMTRQAKLAGVVSTLPAGSVARTRSSWSPSASPV
jgi:hypothetical protein